MNDSLVIVLDCGATNVRAVAVRSDGQIIAKHSLPNATRPDPDFESGLIWDASEIWEKFCRCTRTLVRLIDTTLVQAVVVTTFGVNGAPVDIHGNMLYPVISWQCQRTAPIMDNIDRYITVEKLYETSGVNAFSFNTINSLLWLKENRPEIIDQMAGFLFMPSLFNQRMTGECVNDVTMCGTSMLTDLHIRDFSEEILEATGLPRKFFIQVEAGEIIGELSPVAASELGLKDGIKVVAGGHDTQMALVGSGAGVNEPVLSSGTWEVLMARTEQAKPGKASFEAGITNELDAIPGLLNTGAQWLGSGHVEWIRSMFYAKESIDKPDEVYKTMIQEAAACEASGATPEFDAEFASGLGAIKNLDLKTTRGEIFRAALESLVEKTAVNLQHLQEVGNFQPASLIVVGGGSRNMLWNQMRANKLGIPVKIAAQTETTVLGAALFAHVALGNFSSVEEAVNKVCRKYKTVKPEA